ncbi:MAG: DUF6797 domain-containing protein [Phycisphaeraceae bacterium]
MRTRLNRILLLAMAVGGFTSIAIGEDAPVPPRPQKLGTYEYMDYGPVIAHTIRANWPAKNIAYKGLAVRLGERGDAALIYDTDLMRVAAGTIGSAGTGGWIDLSKTNHTSYKGNDDAHVEGRQVIATSVQPGWANPTNGTWTDPRKFALGPLPKTWSHYKGYYRHGDSVVIKYTVGDSTIHELPGLIDLKSARVFTRSFDVGKSAGDLALVICESEKAKGRLFKLGLGSNEVEADHSPAGNHLALLTSEQNKMVTKTFVGGAALPEGAMWKLIEGNRVTLHIPAKATPCKFQVRFTSVELNQGLDELAVHLEVEAFLGSEAKLPDCVALTQGGPARWKNEVTTQGSLGKAKGAYVVDTLKCPEENPWNAWMRPVGFDFFADGRRAAISTWNGDVWIVSGIDESLGKLSWKRFASGLYEPLGLVIRNDEIFVIGYDQLSRLTDLNADGEADFYENFNNDGITYPRAYTLCLSTDSKGNFYTIRNGNRAPDNIPQHGCIHRISADGSKLEVFATGLRSANGLGIGAGALGEVIACADQEGNWTPASRIDFLKQGDYVGYKPHAQRPPGVPVPDYKPPVCWLPKGFDNSPGDLVQVPPVFDDAKGRWGPLQGAWLGTSYGQCRLYLVMYEEVEGVVQGGVVEFPLSFSSGIMRTRFNPRDGQLYLAGLKGWQTRGALDSGFFRVRYTGKPLNMPVHVTAQSNGLVLTFSDAMDRELAEDESSYQVQRWNYIYSEKYGSPEVTLADPKKQGRDEVKIAQASLSKDGKNVFLEIKDMKPAMQMMIKMNLESEKGETVKHEVFITVHHVAK